MSANTDPTPSARIAERIVERIKKSEKEQYGAEAFGAAGESMLHSREIAALRALGVATAAFQAMSDADDLCSTCQGSGAVYADGEAHLYGSNARTRDCDSCGGRGRIVVDVQDKIAAALSAIAAHLEEGK